MSLLQLIRRHISGDSGELSHEDLEENRISIEHGFRILSSYPGGPVSSHEAVF
jgi:hypothetical protein